VTVIEEDAPTTAQEHVYAGEEDVVTTHTDGFAAVQGALRTLSMLIGFAYLVVASLLLFRLVFALTGANPANGFVDFIYDTSGPLVAPFEGIVNESLTEDGVFEPETVIALAVYGVIALLAIVFLSIVMSAPRTTPQREVVTRERHAHLDREV
jgi:hypothetical protein